ncbi:MAG: class I SAM-dependent DNA methyltransferase [Phycisphaerae bacterium]|nr:class I SAM-dependent DNA methyltransferase [Phycisphaerae bacterium]
MAKTKAAGQLTIKQSLNKSFRKLRPTRAEIETLRSGLVKMLAGVNLKESEEYHKNLIRDFFSKTAFVDYFINTKERNDLVIHNDKSPKSSVGVSIETKPPGNKTEMPTPHNLNKKAVQQLVLYFLRERIHNENKDVHHLIVTDLYKWFIFDGKDFEKHFYENPKLKKDFIHFEQKRMSSEKTEVFYKEIASPALEQVKRELKFVYFDIRDYEKYLENINDENDRQLIDLQKIFSAIHLLNLPFVNDSNTLNKQFYSELLHIIGLEEYREKGKKLIRRKENGKRDEDSLIEATISKLVSLDKLSRIKDIEQFGQSRDEQLFNISLELVITWINRVLFLKLLESQIVSYHENSRDYLFLNTEKVSEYDDLSTLFFDVLAREPKERRKTIQDKFANVPYLNSSLFEPTELEKDTIDISNLPDHTALPLYNRTVLKNSIGKLNTLEYLFRFLDAYDFSSEGKEAISEDNKTLINASVLGLIFEKINGYKDGSYFTPGFITMYMCRETVRRAIVEKFKEKRKDFTSDNFIDLVIYTQKAYEKETIEEYNNIVNSLKICDPAVGSGHFLVSALNEIIAIKAELGILVDETGKPLRDYAIDVENDELVVLDHHGEFFKYDTKGRQSQIVQKTLFHEKERIIELCLFGVDINPNSVKICRLRLWIELLKNAYYKENGELETLPNIDINIKCGNSLISFLLLDSNIRTIFDGDVNLRRYKDSVTLYKHALNKDVRDKMRHFIESVKKRLQASPIYESANLIELKKLTGKVNELLTPQMLYEESSEEKKAREKKLAIVKAKIEKLSFKVKKDELEKSKQTALEWRFEFPELLDANTTDFLGFDIVIGNPPYIKENDDKTVFDGLRKLEVYQGKMDIWYLFCGLGLDLLKDNGHLCFIATNNWVTNFGAKKLRNKIVHHSKLLKLIDFNNFMVFNEASIQTMILMLQKNHEEDNYSFDYRKVVDANNNFKHEDILCERNDVSMSNVTLLTPVFNREKMVDQFFTFANKTIDSILYKMTRDPDFFLKNRKEFAQGIVFPQDYLNKSNAIKLGNKFDIGKGIFALSNHELEDMGLSIREKEDLIRPYYTSQQLHKYWAEEENQEWIIYTTSEFKKPEKMKSYPNLQEHLDQFVSVITSDNKPYGLHRARDEKFFNGEKIITIRKSPDEPVFTYTDFPCYVSAAFYVIKTDKVNLKYLTALLNSRLIKFWLNYKGKKQGTNFQVDAEPLSQIPLKKISLKEQEPFIELVDNILTERKRDPELECEIDMLVYELYGLTAEEKKIVDEATK